MWNNKRHCRHSAIIGKLYGDSLRLHWMDPLDCITKDQDGTKIADFTGSSIYSFCFLHQNKSLLIVVINHNMKHKPSLTDYHYKLIFLEARNWFVYVSIHLPLLILSLFESKFSFRMSWWAAGRFIQTAMILTDHRVKTVAWCWCRRTALFVGQWPHHWSIWRS